MVVVGTVVVVVVVGTVDLLQVTVALRVTVVVPAQEDSRLHPRPLLLARILSEFQHSISHELHLQRPLREGCGSGSLLSMRTDQGTSPSTSFVSGKLPFQVITLWHIFAICRESFD